MSNFCLKFCQNSNCFCYSKETGCPIFLTNSKCFTLILKIIQLSNSIIFSIIEDVIRYISGPLGIRIRRFYYQRRLKECGIGIIIDTGVFFNNPKAITIGNYVWIDKNAHFIAGKLQHENVKKVNEELNITVGEIVIGSHIHIGINAIIQGHGGVKIGDYFTSSANCCIYTVSNDVNQCCFGTYNQGEGNIFYVQSSIVIQNNVWLGLGVTVLGGEIGANTFIKPQSIVTKDIQENSIAEGFPAERIKNRFTK
jgi:acetyltransferase-like isoleucine patch superfamily enzyme